MSEYEVTGIEAMILDAGCRQYSTKFVIPEVIRDGFKIIDLSGFPVTELYSEGKIVNSLLRRGLLNLLKRVEGGFEISFKWRKKWEMEENWK